MSNKADMYFPKTTCLMFNGLVSNNSIVPDLYSSENIRIVMEGMKINTVQKAMLKNCARVA